MPIEPDRTPEEGYHFTEDMTDRTIDWIRQQKALMADKPFFIYYAPGATHAPHSVPAEWSDKYRGKFDEGWDRLREETLARQKELGVVPQDAELTARPAEIPGWDDMPDDLKPVLARQMEVYAGFLEHTDHHVGRLVDALADLEILDDTLIYYIIGDNGASAEGTPQGCFNELIVLNGAGGLETTEFMASRIDDFGTPRAFNHYAVGWAHAMDTPFQWTKQVASHWGGTRNGTVVHWPAGISARGEVRSQFHHVIDVAPSILAAAGLPEPGSVNGVQQMPIHGVAMNYSFDDAAAEDRHTTQYFEMFCNRGIYHQGWTAVTRHSIPWAVTEMPAFDDDVWELYGPDDWTQAHDLSASEPEKLHELQRLFLIEAMKYNVLPLDDRRFERFNADSRRSSSADQGQVADAVRRDGPDLGEQHRGDQEQVLRTDRGGRRPRGRRQRRDRLPRAAPSVGSSLYAKEGRPAFCYNLFGLQQFKTYGAEQIPAGTHQVRMEFAYDGGGLAKGGDVTLLVDGSPVGKGRVDGTVPMLFSADETTDVGSDTATPVSDDYRSEDSGFTGRVNWVQIDIDEAAEDLDHLITPEERFRVAMARQ